jgi:hypothetical protein
MQKNRDRPLWITKWFSLEALKNDNERKKNTFLEWQ